MSENESERGGEEDDDDSDNDLEIVLEQSGTADSTGAASGGTEAPANKAKITLTVEEENFAKKFHPAASKIDKERKIPLRHVSGSGSSIKKQGARKHDVKQTASQRFSKPILAGAWRATVLWGLLHECRVVQV